MLGNARKIQRNLYIGVYFRNYTSGMQMTMFRQIHFHVFPDVSYVTAFIVKELLYIKISIPTAITDNKLESLALLKLQMPLITILLKFL